MAPVGLHLAAAQEGDDDEAALEREAAEILLDVVAADHVEDDVDAALAGDPRDLGDEVLRPVVDRMSGADRPAERRLVVAARGRDHRRAELLRDLDRRQPDTARAAVDQHGLAGAQPPAVEEIVPDGEEVSGNDAASTSDSPFGIGRHHPAGVVQYSA